ncbi:hypothetical protein BJ085DRAFT_28016 [Dimargaris cristalligena]|uniref:Uncharacterized protein n=1 Tax=Dimargaris cristalligena TaxID=215637 RepID=A0A4P9ZVA9_9FUNG|nr:hypothetical protein BJ085DRAFT_28016 [Dimargaris cristalligena]|eukprot:RKP36772.1 hypothetical protein BJ085DRAFT_28016 [Dimargaris cristalligena]
MVMQVLVFECTAGCHFNHWSEALEWLSTALACASTSSGAGSLATDPTRLITPQVEKTPETLALLQYLRRQVEQRERTGPVVGRAQDRLRAEYQGTYELYSRTLQRLGVPWESLPDSLQLTLEALADIAGILQLRDCHASSYQGALFDLANQQRQTQLELNRIERQQRRVTHHKRAARQQLSVIRSTIRDSSAVKPAEEQKMREWRHNAQLLAQKGEEYRDRADHLINQYNSLGVETKRLDYATLKTTDRHVDELSKSLAQKSSKLESYMALPPVRFDLGHHRAYRSEHGPQVAPGGQGRATFGPEYPKQAHVSTINSTLGKSSSYFGPIRPGLRCLAL